VKSKVILLVEDNPSDIELTRRAFAKARIANDVIVAENGREALDYLFRSGKYADRDIDAVPMLILLDIKMPVMDGLETLKYIRTDELTRRLPVVILTSSREEEDLARSYDLGVNSYICKPVDFNQFAEAVKTLGLYWLVLNEAPPLPK
jgi:CheY-like chemotaxis protein